jgi:hypothetical protein
MYLIQFLMAAGSSLSNNWLHGAHNFKCWYSKATLEIPRRLWNPKFQYNVHKTLPLDLSVSSSIHFNMKRPYASLFRLNLLTF